MANDFYSDSGYPGYSADGDSASARSEFQLVRQGFDKMPSLTGTALRIIRVNAAGTGLEAVTLTSAKILAADGSSPATANIPMGGFKLTGLAAGSAAGDSVRYEQVADLAIAQTHAATTKTTPVDADELPLADSAATYGLKRLTFANLRATLANFLVAITGLTGSAKLPSGTTAQRDAAPADGFTRVNATTGLLEYYVAGAWKSQDTAGDTHAATSKTTPVDADELPIADSASSFSLKKLTFANLAAWVRLLLASPGPIGGTTPAAGTFTNLSATTGFDLGQTWQDVTASRAGGVTYTNTTGKPIVVSVFPTNSGSTGTTGVILTVNGIDIVANAGLNGIGPGNLSYSAVAKIPPGGTYRATIFSATIARWSELR